MMTNLVGTTLGQYEIIELIGEGGMASVYKAWQPSLRRYVALKVLAPHLTGDAEFVQRFQQEAVSAANLKHPNIVTIHDVGTEGGYHYIAMEFIEGVSLEERIRSGQAFAPEQVVNVISQVGSALDYAHQRGFVHRDIKPANVLLDQSGRAVLTDFGIVKALSGSGLTAALTQAGTVYGTPQYMSPEQIRDEPLDHRSDLYSLGIVCYEMLSGQVPFDGTTTHAVLYAQVNTPPPPLRQALGPEVPPPVEAVVDRMLAKEQENRYNSAGAFARDLAQAAAGVWPAGLSGETAVVAGVRRTPTGTAVLETAPGVVMAPPARARRSRWPLAVGIGAAGLALVVVAVGGVLLLSGVNPLESVQATLALRRAQEALAAGDYTVAVDGFSQVLESDPDSAEAIEGQLEAAAELAVAGDLDGAIEAYETVWQARPGEVRALRGIGQAYEAKGAWGEAAIWYERWAQAAPQDEGSFLALGSARFNLGEHERTVEAYEQADALGADPAEVDANLGLAYFELAQYEKAARRLQNAISQNPEDFRLQRALGLAYYELAEYDKAIEPLRDAVSQDSEDFELQRALGLSLYAQDQCEQATGHLNEAVRLGADRPTGELVDVHYARGGCYFEQQEYEQAITSYEQAQELDPEGQSAWAEGAQANLDEAYSRLAEEVMEEAVLDLDFSNIVTEGDETYAIAKTGQRARIEGPVRLVDGPWESSQALVVEEGSNIINSNPLLNGEYRDGLAPACSLGGDISSVTPSESTLHTQYGGRSQKLVFTGSSDSTPFFWQDARYSASTQYSVRVRIYIESLGTSIRVRIYDGESFLDTDLTTTGWHEVVETLTSTATISNDDILLYSPSEDAATVFVDVIMVEEKPCVTSPFDGDAGDGYAWSLVPHASPSTRAATEVSLDDSAVLISGRDTVSIRVVVQAPYDYDDTWPVTYSRILDCYDPITGHRAGVLFRADEDRVYLYLQGDIVQPSSVATFSAGDWLDIVATFDYLADEYRLYLGGAAVALGTSTLSAPTVSEVNLGSDSSGANQGGFAFVKFAIYGRILAIHEVAALHVVDGAESKQPW
jgi:tetratricopeptide (TPR) repeat protein